MTALRLWLRRLLWGTLALGVLASTGLLVFLTWVWRELPPLDTLQNYQPALITQVWDRQGRLLTDYAAERREIVSLDEMPEYLVQAFLAAEDDQFYSHFGIQPMGILRAAMANLRAGGVRQGGSTITQQVARTFFLTQKRTMMRKIREILLALRLEANLSKDEILFMYLNQLYLGRGAYGVGAASQLYFNKRVGELDLAEAAVLAGLPPAPTAYAPHVAPERARRRQLYVLGRLEHLGWLPPEEIEAARAQPVKIVRWEAPFWNAPWAADSIRQWLIRRFGEDAVLRGGLQIYTTIDLELTRKADAALRKGLEDHDRRQGWRGPVTRHTQAAWPAWRAKAAADLARQLARRDRGDALAWVGPAEAADDVTDPVARYGAAVTAALDDTLEFAGLVTGFDRKREWAWIDFGLGVGHIPGHAMRWAREPDPTLTSIQAPVRTPWARLRTGDEVRIRRLRADAEWDEGVQRLHAAYKPPSADRPGAASLELFQLPEAQAALVAMLPQTGEIVAFIGGYDFSTSQFNRALDARRQPGSAFKPVVYALALERGMTPASVLVDTPIVYEDVEREFRWKPRNYEGKFYGKMTLTDALTYSRNVVTIQLVREFGIRAVQDMGRRLGIESALPPDLSMALGSGVLTPLELTRVYATLANQGRRPEPAMVREVWDASGRLIYRYAPPTTDAAALPFAPFAAAPPPQPREVPFGLRQPSEVSAPALDAFPEAISPAAAYQATFLMRSVVERGTGWRARTVGRPAAGKTGTTDDNIDSWFAGYTPELAVSVWVGYDQLRSLGRVETGSRAAAPIWADFVRAARLNSGLEDFPVPEGIVYRQIDIETGRPATPLSRRTLQMPFVEGRTPEDLDEERGEVGLGLGAREDFLHDIDDW